MMRRHVPEKATDKDHRQSRRRHLPAVSLSNRSEPTAQKMRTHFFVTEASVESIESQLTASGISVLSIVSIQPQRPVIVKIMTANDC